MLTAAAQGVSLASANGQELALEKPSSCCFCFSLCPVSADSLYKGTQTVFTYPLVF